MSALDEHAISTLVAMARALYPHDFLDDGPYRRAVETVVDRADPVLMTEGAAGLDQAARGNFADLSEADQVAVLKRIEGSAFFETMRGGVVRHLYSDPEVWPHFRYEGPSAHLGGYVKRGFADIAWIPED